MTNNAYVVPSIVGGLAGVAVFLALSAASPSSSISAHYQSGLQKLSLGEDSGIGGGNSNCNSSIPGPAAAAAIAATISSNINSDNDANVYHEEQNPPGTCLLELPTEWEPPSSIPLPADYHDVWTEEEQTLAEYASQKSLDELVGFFDGIDEERILNLGTNGINSVIDQCFASANKPAFHQKACEGANRIMKIINGGEGWACRRMRMKTKMLFYAHYLTLIFPLDRELKEIRSHYIKVVQKSMDQCEDLDEFLAASDVSWRDNLDLDNPAALSRDILRDYVHQQGLINLYSIPEFVVPAEVDHFIWRLWTFAAKYPYLDADEGIGYRAETRKHGYLLTHVAYWPTGYGRHRQFLSDSRYVYDYVRKNYWAAARTFDADPDLLAEFIDILRACGCTEDDDVMVRYGARLFLNSFKAHGESFMSHTNSDYSAIHGPWTAIAAVSRFQVEPIVPGSHGYNWRKVLESGARAERESRQLESTISE